MKKITFKPVIIRQFHNYFSAHILKTRLENEGINCYLMDEHTSTLNPVLGFAIGAIKLVVEESDRELTLSILKEYDKELRAASLCPVCHTGTFEEVPDRGSPNMITAILTWLFSSYAVSVKNIYKCRNCGQEAETLPDSPEINN